MWERGGSVWERGVCVGEGSEEGREKALCLLVGLVYALWRETHARGVRAVRVSERDKNGRCDKKRNGGGGGAIGRNARNATRVEICASGLSGAARGGY